MDTIVRYGIPMVILSGVAALCLGARTRPISRGARLALAGVAALPLVGSGTLHLVHPAAFVPLLPPWVPARTWIIVATGLPELAGAAALFIPGYQKAAGRWLIVMMVAIFPANIYVAGQTVQGLAMPGVPVRTAMQVAYMLLLALASGGWPVGLRTARVTPPQAL